MNYDVIIVGAGPAGIFTAYELKNQKPNYNILLIEEEHFQMENYL